MGAIRYDQLQSQTNSEEQEKSVELFWSVDQQERSIQFGVAHNYGSSYLAVGFSDAGGMKGSNIFVGRGDNNGSFVLEERFTPVYGAPALVKKQSLQLLSWHQDGNITAFTFKRSLAGCDDQHSTLSLKKPTWFIWAVGENNVFKKHKDDKRGQSLVDLSGTYFKDQTPITLDANTTILPMLMPPITLKGNESTTYCYTFHDFSNLSTKHYIIAENFTIGSKYPHHILTYSCDKPVPEFAKPGTVLCNNYREKGKQDYIEFQNSCQARPYIAWGKGSKPRVHTGEFGKPIGPGPLNVQYMVMEIHFANQNLDQDAVDSGTGFQLTVTSNPRSKEIGMLTVGKNVPSLELAPGGYPSSINECGAQCTGRLGMLPWSGLTPITAALHMHKRGMKINVKHISRNLTELEPFPFMDYFDFNFQTPSFVSSTQQNIMAGDRLVVNCTYDTSTDTVLVPGGYSSEQEMCFAFIEYWPAQQIGNCISYLGVKLPEINYCPWGSNDLEPFYPYLRLPFSPWKNTDENEVCTA